MISYGFSFRASLRKGEHQGVLYLRVVRGGLSRSVTTPYHVWPHEWNRTEKKLIIPQKESERAKQLAEYESLMRSDLQRMERVVRELEKKGDYTIDDITSGYRSTMCNNSVASYIEMLACNLEENGYTRRARAYRTASLRFRNFNGGRDINLEQITASMICDFQQTLKKEGKSMNTISFYMRILRSIYNKAVSEGRIPQGVDNPFSSVYTGVHATRKLALTPKELILLSSSVLENSANKESGRKQLPELTAPMRDALAMFMFCYHARGMCFVDMAHLKKSDIRGDVISYRRQKTGQAMKVRLQPVMARILEHFASYTDGSPYLFPVITAPDKNTRLQYESGLRLQNKRLKKIASLYGIANKFTTHAARHSWATVARNEGLPLAVISEGLGHTNQRTTEIYLASLEQTVLDYASRLVSEAINPGRKRKTNLQKSYASASGGYETMHPHKVYTRKKY